MLLNKTLSVSQMPKSLFYRTNPAYINIYLKEIYASLQVFKNYNGIAW